MFGFYLVIYLKQKVDLYPYKKNHKKKKVKKKPNTIKIFKAFLSFKMQTPLSSSGKLNSQNCFLHSVSAILSILRFPMFHMPAGTLKYNWQKRFFSGSKLHVSSLGDPSR